MDLDVRPIRADEMPDWVATMHTAFHSDRASQAESDYRLGDYGQDLQRTLAAFDGARLVGTYESFPTELTLPGGCCVKVNGISAVTVLPTHHRRGLLRRMIGQDLANAKERGDVASILVAAEFPIYGRFGFGIATERAVHRLQPAYATFTRAAPGSVSLVQPQELRDIAPPIFDRVRRSHAGQIDREPGNWDRRFELVEVPWREKGHVLRCAVYAAPGGDAQGYVTYRVSGEWRQHVPDGKLEIAELMALTPEAYVGLWRYVADVDLVSEVTADMRPVDEPLPWLIQDARKAFQEVMRNDYLWLRAMDIPRLLSQRRYAAEGQVILEISDPLGLSGGCFALEGGPHGATCTSTSRTPDLALSMKALAGISLGGFAPSALHQAGEIQPARDGALEVAERMFHTPRAPWCSTFF